MNLSLRDIATLLGGKIQFGPLPPLDGQLETIERILPTCQHVRRRDVVMWCGPPGSEQAWADCFLEEAFVRGAFGVIAARPVAPWAGRFCLQVDDPHEALCRLARRQARRARGRRVLIVDPQAPSPTYHLVCRVANQNPNVCDFSATNDSLDSMRWQIIGLDTNRTHTVIHTIELPDTDWHQWFQPDVVVFVGHAVASPLSDRIQQFLNSPHVRAARAKLVVPDEVCDEISKECREGGVTTFGWTQRSHIHGQATSGKLTGINRVPVQVPEEWRAAEESVIAAVATVRAMGLNEHTVIGDWIEQGDQRRAA